MKERTNVFQFTRAKENALCGFIKSRTYREDKKKIKKKEKDSCVGGCIEYAIARIVDVFPILPVQNNGTMCVFASDVFRLCESRTQTRERNHPLRALPVNQVLFFHIRTTSSRFPFGRLKEIPTHTHSTKIRPMSIFTQSEKNVNFKDADSSAGLSVKEERYLN